MIISIHQPNFIPWIGYFYKIAKSDTFVILDDVQFTKNSFINRNKIKTPSGEQWLGIPIIQSGKFGQNINQCQIQNQEIHLSKITKSIKLNYAKCEFFDWLYPDLQTILNKKDQTLVSANVALISTILNLLEIKTPFMLASDLHNIEGESTERLISICKELNADKYLYGFGAKNYQEDELFRNAGIELKKNAFIHPDYKQLWGEFIPNLSIIDFLFNIGPEAIPFFKND